MLKRILAFSIMLCMLLPLSMIVSAAEVSPTSISVIERLKKDNNIDFSDMSIDELNLLINNIANGEYIQSRAGSLSEVQLAWLAAAEIARDYGYDCAASMVEHSVWNTGYYESKVSCSNETPVINKLETTSVYKNHKKAIQDCGSTTFSGSFIITKNDSSDLFYALHKVSTSATGTSLGNTSLSYVVHIHDVFDFDYDNDYDDLFTSLVNNWAWLCQQTDVLNTISIDLYTTA